MGLASSQARLISLTSRQHSVEYKAQKLLHDKMQLSNDSDAVYNKYMNALDSVTLNTKQINSEGKVGWIAGNINNLLRKDANENTTGEVFFVQDLNNGRLYIPTDIGNLFESHAGGSEEDMRAFVTAASGNSIIYTTIDKNAYVKEEYESALAYGWNNIMTYNEYLEYQDSLREDTASQLVAKYAYQAMPCKTDGLYEKLSSNNTIDFINKINTIIGSKYFDDCYSTQEQDVLTSLSSLMFGTTALQRINNVYKAMNGANITGYTYSASVITALSNYSTASMGNYETLGDAVNNILRQARDRRFYSDSYKADKNITTEDIEHYKKYLSLEKANNPYVPNYETTSNDAKKAQYWENIYKAILQNGWISVTDSQAKNEKWTTNMVKSNLAILTTWDEEYETISRTATELSASIREVTNENYIEKVSQIYEAEMAEINAKDVNIDEKLSKMETEREAITTEIDGIKNIINDNVDAHFKTFA